MLKEPLALYCRFFLEPRKTEEGCLARREVANWKKIPLALSSDYVHCMPCGRQLLEWLPKRWSFPFRKWHIKGVQSHRDLMIEAHGEHKVDQCLPQANSPSCEFALHAGPQKSARKRHTVNAPGAILSFRAAPPRRRTAHPRASGLRLA